MEKYTWSKKLEVGDETIDSQHKQLVETYNSLIDQSQTVNSIAELVPTLVFLCEYTEKHFNDEEELQRKCRFPDYSKHKLLHDNFKKTVAGFMAQIKTVTSVEGLSSKLHTIVGVWLLNHIVMEDSKMAKYILKWRYNT
jgi:hemerythrin